MLAQWGEDVGDCARGPWASWSSREPVVDLAAPRLRTRCCGGIADRGENRDPRRAAIEIQIDGGGAIRERPLRRKSFCLASRPWKTLNPLEMRVLELRSS